MDGRTFVKCLKDSGLIDERLKTCDADIIFAKWKAKGSRKIEFSTFMQALAEVSCRRRMPARCVFDLVCNSSGPEYEMSRAEVAGPERFFYDRSTYTGTHRHGGPTSEGNVISDAGLVNRDKQHEMACSADRRARALADTGGPLPTLLGCRSPREAGKLASPRWGAKQAAASSQVKESHGRLDTDICGPLKGPERFYYDRSTYTGTHKNSGPTSSGSGVGKDGYSDLGVLVRRELVQDDDLQRRRRRCAVVGWDSPLSSPRIGSSSSLDRRMFPGQGAESKYISPRPTSSQSAPARATLSSSMSEQELGRWTSKMPSAPLVSPRCIRGANVAPVVATAVATFSNPPLWSASTPPPLVRCSNGWTPLAIPRSGSLTVML